MDMEGTKFGSGPRELGGSVDLINRYKLWPHYELFCKSSLPSSISKTKYLNNVVGDTEIRKGEGMEVDQLFRNTAGLRERKAIHPLDLNILREAFQIRDTTLVNLPLAEKSYITAAFAKSKTACKHKGWKHKKQKIKDKDHKKDKYSQKERS